MPKHRPRPSQTWRTFLANHVRDLVSLDFFTVHTLQACAYYSFPSYSLTTAPHGPLTADATEPEWNGYLLQVACSCGVVFERWVTPEEADTDLISWSDGKASRN